MRGQAARDTHTQEAHITSVVHAHTRCADPGGRPCVRAGGDGRGKRWAGRYIPPAAAAAAGAAGSTGAALLSLTAASWIPNPPALLSSIADVTPRTQAEQPSWSAVEQRTWGGLVAARVEKDPPVRPGPRRSPPSAWPRRVEGSPWAQPPPAAPP
jgi:hypothetical protein